ncbi:uncharacterized protein LOC135489586 [Lineus longissimus]|uniref:uncharacterized protein LOC135489586 n=1 Tax=Lineus longissimus TaxID=88925 RepID=UPI00315E02A7
MTDMEELVRSGTLSSLSQTYDPRECLALRTTERPPSEAPKTTRRMTTKEIVTRVPTVKPTTARGTSAPCPGDLDDWTEMLQSSPCMSSFMTAVQIVQSGGFTSVEACRAFMSVLICIRTHHQVELTCALEIVEVYTPGMSATVSVYWDTLSIDMCDAELSDDRCSMSVPDLIANTGKSMCLQHATSIYTSYQMEGFGVNTCKSTRDFITCMADYFESCLQYDAAGTVALLRPVIVQELGVDPWTCWVGTTLPPVQTTRPTVRTTIPPVETTRPPVRTTMPPVQTTRPPVQTTRAPRETTSVPAETTRMPVETTRPTDRTTIPPVETTRSPVRTTMPPVETTRPPVRTTIPPVQTTMPPVQTTRMPVHSTEQPILTTPATTMPPVITTTEAPPVIVDGEFKVSNLNFSQELLNETSPEFQQLADTFKDLLMDAYNKSAFGEDIAYIEIIGFSAGSVVINFRIVFKPKPVVATSAPETGTTVGSATGTPSSVTVRPVNGSTPGRPDPVTKAPVVFPVLSQASILAVLDKYIATKPTITASNGESIAVEIDPASIVVQIVTTTTSTTTTTTPQPTTTTPQRMTTTPEQMTTAQEPTTALPPTTATPEGTEVDVEFKITNQNFTEDLLNKSSDAYKELERQIIELLIQIYGNSSIADLIDSIEITGFAPGSIVVGYKMSIMKKLNQQPLKSSSSDPIEDAMEEEYDDDESELTKMAHRMLHDAAEKRRLGKYSVLLSSIKAKVSGKKWALLGERACQDVTTMFKLENSKCGRFKVIANSSASIKEKCRLFNEALGCLVPEAVSSYRCSAGTVKQLLYTSRALMEQWYKFDYVNCLVDEQSFSQIAPDAKVQAGLPADFTCKQPQGLMEMTGCVVPILDLQKNIISGNKDRVCRSFSSLMGCLMTSARLAGCQATDAYKTILDNLDFIKEKFSGFNPLQCWMTDNDLVVSPSDSPAKLAPTKPAPTKPDSSWCRDVTSFQSMTQYCPQLATQFSQAPDCSIFRNLLSCLTYKLAGKCSMDDIMYMLFTSRKHIAQAYNNFNIIPCLISTGMMLPVPPNQDLIASLPDDFSCWDIKQIVKIGACDVVLSDFTKKTLVAVNPSVRCNEFSAVASCFLATGAQAGCATHDVFTAIIDGIAFFKDKIGFDPVECFTQEGFSESSSPQPVNPVPPTQPVPTRSDMVMTTKVPVAPPVYPPLGFCPGDVFSLISQVFLTRCSSPYNAFYAEAGQNDVIISCSRASSVIDCGVKQSTCSREEIIDHIRMNTLLLRSLFNNFDISQCLPKSQK